MYICVYVCVCNFACMYTYVGMLCVYVILYYTCVYVCMCMCVCMCMLKSVFLTVFVFVKWRVHGNRCNYLFGNSCSLTDSRHSSVTWQPSRAACRCSRWSPRGTRPVSPPSQSSKHISPRRPQLRCCSSTRSLPIVPDGVRVDYYLLYPCIRFLQIG